MNTLGSGFGGSSANAYSVRDVVESTQPFTLSMRARVLQEEYGLSNGVSCLTANAYGFGFAVLTGEERFVVGIAPDRVDLDARLTISSCLSTIRNSTTTGWKALLADRFFVDNDLVATLRQTETR